MARLVLELPLAASTLSLMAFSPLCMVGRVSRIGPAMACCVEWRTTQSCCSVVNNRGGRFGFEYRERNGCASTNSPNWLLAKVPAAA